MRWPAAPHRVQLASEVERVFEWDERLHRAALQVKAIRTEKRVGRIAAMVDQERIKDDREDGGLGPLHQVASVVPVAGLKPSPRR